MIQALMIEAGVPFRPCGIRDYVDSLCKSMPAGTAVRYHVDVPEKGVTRAHPMAMMMARRQVKRCVRNMPPARLTHTHYNDFSWNGSRSFEDCYGLFTRQVRRLGTSAPHQFITLHEHPWFRNQHVWDSPRTLADHAFGWAAGQCPVPKVLPLDVLLRHRGIHVHQSWHKKILCENSVPEGLISIIPHFVPGCEASGPEVEAFRRRFGLSGKRVLVATGFVFERKCYERILALLQRLPDDVVFCVMGGINGRGSELYLEKLHTLAGRLGVTSRFVVTGYLPEPEMNAGMLAATAFVAPYGEVSTSGSVARCIAAGAPILTGVCPTFSELSANGAGLLSVDATSPDHLLDGINRVLVDDAVALELRRLNGVYARTNSVSACCQRFLDWYKMRLGES